MCIVNEAESNYFYPRDFDNILLVNFYCYIYCFKIKKLNVYHSDFLGGHLKSCQVLLLDPMGICWNSAKLSHFFHIFCISALETSISVKYMKVIVKRHQILKFQKSLPSRLI